MVGQQEWGLIARGQQVKKQVDQMLWRQQTVEIQMTVQPVFVSQKIEQDLKL